MMKRPRRLPIKSNPVFTAAQARRVDVAVQRKLGVTAVVLMENAGSDCARVVLDLLRSRGRVGIVCGKGNNGGDGFVCARHLAAAGVSVDVYLVGHVNQLRAEAAINWLILRRMKKCSVRVIHPGESVDFAALMRSYRIIVDALFGVGLHDPVSGSYARCIEAINHSRARVVSVDIPSGLDATTGVILGVCVQADVTVTFIAPKRGMNIGAGPSCSGRVIVSDLGVVV